MENTNHHLSAQGLPKEDQLSRPASPQGERRLPLSRRFLPEDIGNVLRRNWLFGVVVRRQGFRGLQIAIDRSLWKILEEQLDPSGFLLAGDCGNQFKGQIDAAGNPAGNFPA